MDLHLDRPDGRLAYSSTGPRDAPHTLVAAHSLATSRAWEDESGLFDWDPITEAGHRLVRFDTRGHGASTGSAGAEYYTWPALAADYLAVADEVSPNEAIDGTGQSTGCGVLLWAAVTSPERFRRLVLVIPPTRGAARAAQAQLYIAAAQMIEFRGIEAWQRVVAVAPPAPMLVAGGWARPSWLAVSEHLLPSVFRGAAQSVLPTDDQLAAVDSPVLVLAWNSDPSHPLAAAKHLAERLPNGTLEVAETPEAVRGWGARVALFLGESLPVPQGSGTGEV